MTSSTRVFIGLLLGIFSGLALNAFSPELVPTASSVAQPIGRLWLNALQMTIVPLVVSLLIVGINQANDVAESGRVARRAMVWILFFLLLSGTLVAIMAPLMLNWLPHDPQLMNTLKQLASNAPAVMHLPHQRPIGPRDSSPPTSCRRRCRPPSCPWWRSPCCSRSR